LIKIKQSGVTYCLKKVTKELYLTAHLHSAIKDTPLKQDGGYFMAVELRNRVAMDGKTMLHDLSRPFRRIPMHTD